MTSRRSFLIGAASLLAAPAIVRADSIMKLWVPKREIVRLTWPTIAEIASRMAPDGMIADIAEMLATTDRILVDSGWREIA